MATAWFCVDKVETSETAQSEDVRLYGFLLFSLLVYFPGQTASKKCDENLSPSHQAPPIHPSIRPFRNQPIGSQSVTQHEILERCEQDLLVYNNSLAWPVVINSHVKLDQAGSVIRHRIAT